MNWYVRLLIRCWKRRYRLCSRSRMTVRIHSTKASLSLSPLGFICSTICFWREISCSPRCCMLSSAASSISACLWALARGVISEDLDDVEGTTWMAEPDELSPGVSSFWFLSTAGAVPAIFSFSCKGRKNIYLSKKVSCFQVNICIILHLK